MAAATLAAFYVIVIGWASGIDHLASQAAADWPYLTAIVAGFGTQVALLVELRHRQRARRTEQAAAGAGASASVVGMVACCAHHLADLLPIVGISGAAAFLTDWRVEFMLAGIAVNAVGVVIAARRLRDDTRHHRLVGGGAWHAAA
jgi:phosphoribosylcarboxyaminoimidazole (NCAIR) mutase